MKDSKYCVYYIKNNIFFYRMCTGMNGSIPLYNTNEMDVINYIKNTFKINDNDIEKI